MIQQKNELFLDINQSLEQKNGALTIIVKAPF